MVTYGNTIAGSDNRRRLPSVAQCNFQSVPRFALADNRIGKRKGRIVQSGDTLHGKTVVL